MAASPRPGLFVIASARRLEVLEGLAAKGIATVELDVTNKESIVRCREEVSKITSGRLDILVNNAGRTHVEAATDLDMDEVRATFETNVFSVMAMCQAFVQLLIEARGLIINIASIASIAPYAFASAYSASKGAVIAYSRTLRLELRPFGVRVTVGMIGTVRSNIASKPRSLPADSLYLPIADVFEQRQTFSQTNKTMETSEFARHLVAAALRPEAPLFLRSWFGRPDWFWCGGMATVAWLGTVLGEWVVDASCWRLFRLWKLKEIVDQKLKKA
ncbi:short chain dehydrogenase reductase [Grosmannia clavigera kw1407]|uniref:Short chain dehydrogenase reductase n=1 Tax=Grosmannia clavigera (strain kw1407 / UAMH 11150) TaxID=655863 RepID=F0X820_GROCL|nr:short chain dehydrogenase reductase [Grosmannia clavigera kw1407]EFX05266.1 short chain dehydrogenase reductase [Grosmannia clavigera kw1407]